MLARGASQVLLSLVLTRHPRSHREFAYQTGLDEPLALLTNLERHGLITIVTQEVKGDENVVLPQPSNIATEIAVLVNGSAGQMDTSLVSRDSQTGEDDPLEACRIADEHGVRKEKIAALTRIWSIAFPLPEYEYSPLGHKLALWLTSGGRKTEDMGAMILDLGERNRDRVIEWPGAYVKRAIEREEAIGRGGEISSDLRELARWGKEHYDQENINGT